MANDWILDVLADLKSFARKNNLTALASHLDDATMVAAAEIASQDGKATTDAPKNGSEAGGRVSQRTGTRQEA